MTNWSRSVVNLLPEICTTSKSLFHNSVGLFSTNVFLRHHQAHQAETDGPDLSVNESGHRELGRWKVELRLVALQYAPSMQSHGSERAPWLFYIFCPTSRCATNVWLVSSNGFTTLLMPCRRGRRLDSPNSEAYSRQVRRTQLGLCLRTPSWLVWTCLALKWGY